MKISVIKKPKLQYHPCYFFCLFLWNQGERNHSMHYRSGWCHMPCFSESNVACILLIYRLKLSKHDSVTYPTDPLLSLLLLFFKCLLIIFICFYWKIDGTWRSLIIRLGLNIAERIFHLWIQADFHIIKKLKWVKQIENYRKKMSLVWSSGHWYASAVTLK